MGCQLDRWHGEVGAWLFFVHDGARADDLWIVVEEKRKKEMSRQISVECEKGSVLPTSSSRSCVLAWIGGGASAPAPALASCPVGASLRSSSISSPENPKLKPCDIVVTCEERRCLCCCWGVKWGVEI